MQAAARHAAQCCMFRAGMIARQTALQAHSNAHTHICSAFATQSASRNAAGPTILRFFASLLTSTTRSTASRILPPSTLQHTMQHSGRTINTADHQRMFARTFFRQRQGYVSFDPPATSMADQRGMKMVGVSVHACAHYNAKLQQHNTTPHSNTRWPTSASLQLVLSPLCGSPIVKRYPLPIGNTQCWSMHRLNRPWASKYSNRYVSMMLDYWSSVLDECGC